MQITTSERDGALVVHVSGPVTAATAPELESLLLERVAVGQKAMVIDLTDVDFMSSAGLRAVVATSKALHPAGKLAVCGLSAAVKQVFDVAGLSFRLELYSDVDAALAAVK